MAPKPLPDRAHLLQLLRYDRQTGKLFWRARPGAYRFNGLYAGEEAGTEAGGYINVRIDGERFRAHRVIWKMVYGDEPPEIDHRRGTKTNNRLSNLRAATRTINTRNCRRRRDNTSGQTGVSATKHGTWIAYIHDAGERVTLGFFKSRSAAIAARRRAEKDLGYAARHGTAA